MSTHSYSSDNGKRIRVLLIIGLLSVVAAWLLHLVLDLLPFSVPWWFDVPSVLGFFALIRTVFDKSLWRIFLLRKLLFINLPDLNGVWEGQLVSLYSGHSTQVDATLKIIQTWTNIQILLETDTSISRSRAAAFELDQPFGPYLTYQYLCEPKPGAADSMHTHRGTAELRIKESGSLLEGEYYTGRDRQTYGSLSFRQINPT